MWRHSDDGSQSEHRLLLLSLHLHRLLLPGGVHFDGWGAHTAKCNSAYLTAAAAIGATIDDVKLFVKRVDKVLGKLEEDGENREVLSRKTKELMM